MTRDCRKCDEQGVRRVRSGIRALALSDEDHRRTRGALDELLTTDIGDEFGSIGTSTELSRDDHAHALPHDSTLEFDATDGLKVNVQDVIEHLQERIQYYTSSSNYSSDAGATVGQAYATSQYRKIITKVEVLLNPLVGADGYLVRLDELEADNSIKAKLFTSQTRSAPFGLGVTPRAFTFP